MCWPHARSTTCSTHTRSSGPGPTTRCASGSLNTPRQFVARLRSGTTRSLWLNSAATMAEGFLISHVEWAAGVSPLVWLGACPVVVGDVRQDLLPQVRHRAEVPPAQHTPRQHAEPDLHL